MKNSLPSQQIKKHKHKWVAKDSLNEKWCFCRDVIAVKPSQQIPTSEKVSIEKKIDTNLQIEKSLERFRKEFTYPKGHILDELVKIGKADKIESFLKQELEAAAESARKEAVAESMDTVAKTMTRMNQVTGMGNIVKALAELAKPKGEDK